MERHDWITQFAVFWSLERLERSTWNGGLKLQCNRSKMWNAKTAMISVVRICRIWCGLHRQKAYAARLQLLRSLSGLGVIAAAVGGLEQAQLTGRVAPRGWRWRGIVGGGIERSCWRGCGFLRAWLRGDGAAVGIAGRCRAGASVADLGGVTGNLGTALGGRFESAHCRHSAPPCWAFDVAPMVVAAVVVSACDDACGDLCGRVTNDINQHSDCFHDAAKCCPAQFFTGASGECFGGMTGTNERLGVERGAAHADLLAIVGDNAAEVGEGARGAQHVCGVDWRGGRGTSWRGTYMAGSRLRCAIWRGCIGLLVDAACHLALARTATLADLLPRSVSS